MHRPNAEETCPPSPKCIVVLRYICIVLSAITALPHRLTEALIHVALVSLGIEEEVSELQGHVRVCEGHVVEEGVFGGL